jgi:2-methylisocitrate lyase-like PEP mutase family enzyme
MGEHARTLRRLLAAPEMVRTPGVFDGLSAHLVRAAGFPVAYLTGAGVAVSGYGVPDIGLVTQTEMVQRLAVIATACGLPVIADADTGYGSPLHVTRTVQLYEQAGAAAIQLEDQTFPKRCGHLDDKQVVPADDFCRTLHAALAARRDDTVIIARTDARGPLGLDEAIERARRYAAEGADLLFVEAPQTLAEVERVVAEVAAPQLFNVVPGGKSPLLPDAELERLGFALAIYPIALLGPMATAGSAALATMGGAPARRLDGVRNLFDAVGLADWADLDRSLR